MQGDGEVIWQRELILQLEDGMHALAQTIIALVLFFFFFLCVFRFRKREPH